MITRIKRLVHHYYWDFDYNCAKTMLFCLGEFFDICFEKQTLNAATGMHGAGRFGAQCGLVEGALMFMGIYFVRAGKSDAEVERICYDFAAKFTKEFGSLRCDELRPGGFTAADPPHACEPLSVAAVDFAFNYIKKLDRGRLA
jgi:C_GCAxxG_C_C family probable redox protein